MRVLSGVKPSDRPHIGNYFGAIRQFLEFQHRHEGFYFIADLHALDQVRDAARLREYSFGVALDFLALGLDPKKAVLFRQSDVPEVTQLQWVLGTVTPMGLLERAHAYKDAVAKDKSVDFGLFAYPVLMAADILLYDSDRVPVGQDQTQHLEIARDIAIRFNRTYGKDFDPKTGEGGVLKLPSAVVLEETGIVPGTDGRKMSKSYGNTIPLFGTDAEWRKSVMGIVTDSVPVEAPKDSRKSTVFALLKLFSTPEEIAEIERQYRAGGVGYGSFKERLLRKIQETFGAARERRRQLERDPVEVERVLAEGASRARAVAGQVLGRVLRACGLGA